jgi:hypothetical protein
MWRLRQGCDSLPAGHVKRLRQLAAPLAAFREARGRPVSDFGRILDEVERQAKTAHKRFTVAFVGMYNCGKSSRLEKIRQAKAALEAEARAEAQGKSEAKSPDAAEPLAESSAEPKLPAQKAQRNFTDPDSRIMRDGATKSFEQSYNCQAAVDDQA